MTAATTPRRVTHRDPHRHTHYGSPVTYHVGDRITDRVDMPDGPHRLLGDVIDTGSWLFRVRWVGSHSVAVYAHGHEPDTLRFATPDDERDHITRDARHLAAGELRRIADRHGDWTAAVLHALRLRAAELTGDTR